MVAKCEHRIFFDTTDTEGIFKETMAQYKQCADCFVKQYARYYILGPDGKEHYINVGDILEVYT